MSKSFFVLNTSSKCLTISECLSIIENINAYDLDDIDINKTLLSEVELIIIGRVNCTARGFELAYDKSKKCYSFRIGTPSSIYDWQLMLMYMVELARFLNSKLIITDDDETYDITNIMDYDYISDISLGIKTIKENLDSKYKELILNTLTTAIYIDREIINKYLDVKEFSDFITKVENLDAYVAKQKFYQTDEGIIGVYTLTEDCRTVIPKNPKVSYLYSDNLKDDDVRSYKVMLVVINGDPNDENSYEVINMISIEELFSKLPSDKYYKLDAYNYVIEDLTKEEILNLN